MNIIDFLLFTFKIHNQEILKTYAKMFKAKPVECKLMRIEYQLFEPAKQTNTRFNLFFKSEVVFTSLGAAGFLVPIM